MLDLRLAVTGSVYNDTPVKVRCLNPNHHDPNASMVVYRDNIHCFGCGFHRNNFNEALSLLLGTSLAEAREIAPRLVAQAQEPTQQAPLAPMPSALADIYHDNLLGVRRNRLDWLVSRGLTDAGIQLGRLGHTGSSFVIPVFDSDGQLLTLRFRRDDFYADGTVDSSAPKYRGLKGRNGVFLYGAGWLANEKKRWVVVTEGELDALLLAQHGIPACSATNGAGQADKVPALLHRLRPDVNTLYVCTDQDARGNEAAIRTVLAAARLGFRVVRLSWLEDAKDITEYLSQGGSFGGMIQREYARFDEGRFAQSAA